MSVDGPIQKVVVSEDPAQIELLRMFMMNASLDPPDPHLTDALRDWSERELVAYGAAGFPCELARLVVDLDLVHQLERLLYEHTDRELPQSLHALWLRLPMCPERRLEQDIGAAEDALGGDSPAVLLLRAAYLEGGATRRTAMRRISDAVYEAIDREEAEASE